MKRSLKYGIGTVCFLILSTVVCYYIFIYKPPGYCLTMEMFAKVIDDPARPAGERIDTLIQRSEHYYVKLERPLGTISDCMRIVDMSEATFEQQERAIIIMNDAVQRFASQDLIETLTTYVNQPESSGNVRAIASLGIIEVERSLKHKHGPPTEDQYDAWRYHRLESVPKFEKALRFRGISDSIKSYILSIQGETNMRHQQYDAAIANYQAVIDMKGASDEQKKEAITKLEQLTNKIKTL